MTVVITASLLLYDWKVGTGHPTIFDNIRPALRSVFSRGGSKTGSKPDGDQPPTSEFS